MLSLQIPDDLELKLRILAEQENITPEEFIQKLIIDLAPSRQEIAFFSYAGLWEHRDITQDILRKKAWGGNK